MILLPLSDDVAEVLESAVTENALTLTVLCKVPLKGFAERMTGKSPVSGCTLSVLM